jgi:predicted Zn-dependent protease with MMP-like domain
VGLRDRWPGGRLEHDRANDHVRSVSTRAERLARYRSARERIAPRVSLRAFEALVAEALDDLPPFVQERLENVAVIVEDNGGPELLGLYEGINRLDRGGGYHLVTPDRITIFWRPIIDEVASGDPEAIRREVRKTVIHEVAHHFGMNDAELERLGG